MLLFHVLVPTGGPVQFGHPLTHGLTVKRPDFRPLPLAAKSALLRLLKSKDTPCRPFPSGVPVHFLDALTHGLPSPTETVLETVHDSFTVVIPDVGSRDNRNSHPCKAAPSPQSRVLHLVRLPVSSLYPVRIQPPPAARSLALLPSCPEYRHESLRYSCPLPAITPSAPAHREVPRPLPRRALCAVSGSLRGQCTPIPCAVLPSCPFLLLPSFCCPRLQKILTFRLKPF